MDATRNSSLNLELTPEYVRRILHVTLICKFNYMQHSKTNFRGSEYCAQQDRATSEAQAPF